MSCLPRFRLYTTARTYTTIARDTLRLPGAAATDEVRAFESAIARFVGQPYAVAVPRARVGIYLALKALLRDKKKVVLSPYTIVDVVNMVLCAGGIPVFGDIERATCNLDPKEAERLVDADTGAVLVTHLHGLAMDLGSLGASCRARGVPLIEDAAQAFGARVGGRYVGTFGDVGVYSFGMYKNLTTLFGGMLVTRDRELHDRLRTEVERLPSLERTSLLAKTAHAAITDAVTFPPLFRRLTFPLFRFAQLHDVEALNRLQRGEGTPFVRDEMPDFLLRRLTATQARLGLQGLANVDRDARVRLRYARRYHDALGDLPELLLPPLREDGSHVYNYYPIQYGRRAELLRFLAERGRDVAAQHLHNCADLDCYGAFRRECPNARATAAQTILLPNYPRYGEAEVDENCEAIRAYFAVRVQAGAASHTKPPCASR
jgi:dTDP-4-amino-4,6-dideoxygalactose transaminase